MNDENSIQVLNTALLNTNFRKILLAESSVSFFNKPEDRQIFSALKILDGQTPNVDLPALTSYLETIRKYELCRDRVLEMSPYPSSPASTWHLDQITNNYWTQRLSAYSRDMAESALVPHSTLVIDYKFKIDDIYLKLYEPKKIFTQISALREMSLDDIFSSEGIVTLGIPVIDKILGGGLHPGHLAIIGGRPSSGKSALGLQIARNLPGSVFISYEMPIRQLYARLLSSLSGVPCWRIENPQKLNEEIVPGIFKAHLENKFDISICDMSLRFDELTSALRLYKDRKPPIIIIDYLQLIHGADGENQNIRVGNITRELKRLALELKIPIVLLSQLNRDSVNREPELHDLRDSGCIEQDADVVILLYEAEDGSHKFNVAKNRQGETGAYGIEFDKVRMTFE